MNRFLGRKVQLITLLFFTATGITATILASDHADPIDPLRRQRLEGGLTDLFVFPVDKDGVPVHAFQRKDLLPLHNPIGNLFREPLDSGEQKQIDSLVVILCMRRQLTDNRTLRLEPFTYRIHLDTDLGFDIPTQEQIEAESKLTSAIPIKEGGDHHGPGIVEAYARYGGLVSSPESIEEDLTIEFRLNDDATLQSNYPRFTGSASAGLNRDSGIHSTSGVFDDPFIFPGFYGTNVVAFAIRIPIHHLQSKEYLIWANSYRGNRKTPIDHVGRSLRTQNPRFEMLNQLHPNQHVKAIDQEHDQPSLMRDLLRINLASYFALRNWDFAPDVMFLSLDHPVGFPNGRLLSDDVAAMLAQHGDTLLYELSFEGEAATWPRQTTNDQGAFKSSFPYLRDPHSNPTMPKPIGLTAVSKLKLLAIALVLLLLFLVENWIFAKWYHRRKLRRRHLI